MLLIFQIWRKHRCHSVRNTEWHVFGVGLLPTRKYNCVIAAMGWLQITMKVQCWKRWSQGVVGYEKRTKMYPCYTYVGLCFTIERGRGRGTKR
jgi:hypothetical protein